MRRKKLLSAQARWSQRQKARGRCTRCGKPRNNYKQLCDFHAGQFAAYMKAWRATKAAKGAS